MSDKPILLPDMTFVDHHFEGPFWTDFSMTEPLKDTKETIRIHHDFMSKEMALEIGIRVFNFETHEDHLEGKRQCKFRLRLLGHRKKSLKFFDLDELDELGEFDPVGFGKDLLMSMVDEIKNGGGVGEGK